MQQDGWYQILDGLQPGELVVTERRDLPQQQACRRRSTG